MATREYILSTLEEAWGRVSGPASSDKELKETDKRFIERHFEIVMRRSFRRTSCGECYLDALKEMLIYLRKNDLMEQCSYMLKNGVILQTASDPNIYTNQTLTNEVAERYLRVNPKRIGLFANYPKDWERRISVAKPTAATSKVKPANSSHKKDKDASKGRRLIVAQTTEAPLMQTQSTEEVANPEN